MAGALEHHRAPTARYLPRLPGDRDLTQDELDGGQRDDAAAALCGSAFPADLPGRRIVNLLLGRTSSGATDQSSRSAGLIPGPPRQECHDLALRQNHANLPVEWELTEAFMRTASNGAIQGTRVGAGPAGEPYDRGFAVAKIVVVYHCANKHQTSVPFIWIVTPPPQWECRVCSQPAGTDPLDPPAQAARYMGKKTHLGHVRARRTQAEGDRLMAESLARRDHPEELNG